MTSQIYKQPVRHLASDKANNDDLAMGRLPMVNLNCGKRRELAEVVEYYPRYNNYAVKMRGASSTPNAEKQEGGSYPLVPRKVESPNVAAPLEKGTVVIIDWSLGFAIIDGVLPIGSRIDEIENSNYPKTHLSQEGSDEGEVSEDGRKGGCWRFPGMPDDALQGDWAAVTPDGNYVAALRGKECTMYGSKKAQISVFGTEGKVQTVCSQCEHQSDMGIFNITNDEGHCNLSFKAGIDQLTETGGSNTQWTFHLDIGKEGDYFNMRITDPSGGTLSQVHLSADGRVEVMGINGVSITNAGNSPTFITDGGDVSRKIKGQLNETVTGAVVQEVNSKRIANIRGDDRTFVSAAQTAQVIGNRSVQVGGRQETTVTGGTPADANPTNIAYALNVVNGSYVLDIGNSLRDQAIPSAKAGCSIFVHSGGAITLGQDPLMLVPEAIAINLNTLKPRSIALCGTVATAQFTACLYEPLLTMMNGLLTALDAHQHTVNVAAATTASLAAPFTPMISNLLSPIQSKGVLIGM
jgi:hypothetical protein